MVEKGGGCGETEGAEKRNGGHGVRFFSRVCVLESSG